MINYNLYERKETEDGYDYYVPYDIEKTTICGKTYREIITILNALELERITGIKMCMENLSKYKELIDKEMNEMLRKSFETATNELLQNGSENK